jgi:multiple sugar transport system permease protein
MAAPELTDESVAVSTSEAGPAPKKGRRSYSVLSRSDKRTITAMVGVPTALHIMFVWIPAIATIGLSFTNWNGFKFSSMKWPAPHGL